ncbi:MAG: hypothetical protein ACTTIC_06630 [Helicobacteraceae bacterium]
MVSKSSMDRQTTEYLEKKYDKVFLTAAEVESETLVPASNVPSTSDKPHTWLLRDVVEFLNKPFYNKELNRMPKPEKKKYIISATTDSLNKYWRQSEETSGVVTL